MIKSAFLCIALLAAGLACLLAATPLFAAEMSAGGLTSPDIIGPSVAIKEGGIFVSSGLRLDEQGIRDLKNGISKEIILYIDLFRVWPNWPDEFVLGNTITRTLRCDPVKKEYIASSLWGTTLTEKRFRSCETLTLWALSVPEFKLSGTAEIERARPETAGGHASPDEYFVRVTAEGRLRRLPPVIGYLFFFVREKEFSVRRDSERFRPTSGTNSGITRWKKSS